MGMDQKRTRNAFVGSPVERIEDFRFLRGRGQFVDDLARDDLLHAVILRSSVAHGRIRGIETGAARTRPGVYAIITAADIGAAIPMPLSTARHTFAASASRSSATAPSRWSRAGCWRNGMRRAVN